MSISAPRYASAPFVRTGRGARVLAMAAQEFQRRARWPTYLAIGLTYAALVLTATVFVAFASALGTLTLATFESVFDSPAWPFLILIITTAAGAGSLAEDVGNRSFTLYRARPIHLIDYVTAKTVALGGWLILATVGPGLVVVAITAALGYPSALLALQAAAAYTATGMLAAVFFTGLALALSSLTNRPLYAGVAIFGLVLSLYIGATLVADIGHRTNLLYGSPVDNLQAVARAAFGSPTPAAIDPGVSTPILLGLGVGLWVFALWRMSRVEAIAE